MNVRPAPLSPSPTSRSLVSSALALLLSCALAATVTAEPGDPTTDPLVQNEEGLLIAIGAPAGGQLGVAIDVEDDLAVVGAPGHTGVVYVLRKEGGAWAILTKLVPNYIAHDVALGDRFGADVAISGDHIAVGAPGDDEAEYGAGAVYTFRRAGEDHWSREDKLFSPNAEFEGQFGRSLDLDGPHLVVGAPREDTPDVDSGSAYAFRFENGAWTDATEIVNAQTTRNELLGSSVSIDGTHLAIGAPGFETGGGHRGGVYYHKYSTSLVNWLRFDILTSPFATDLGASVSVAGTFLAAGSPNSAGSDGTELGVVVFYELEGPTYTHRQAFGGISSGERLGSSVDLDVDPTHGPRAVVGAPRRRFGSPSEAGGLSVYRYNQGGFFQEHHTTASDPITGSRLGQAVAIQADEVLAGAPLDVADGARPGSVSIFGRTASQWSQTDRLLGRSHDPTDRFGADVSVSGDLAVVGAFNDSDAAPSAGAAYVFERSEGQWELTARLTAGLHARPGAIFGHSVHTDGERIAVGAPHEDESPGGAAYVFHRNPLGGWITTGQRLVAIDPQHQAFFGDSVSIAGDLLVVGARQADGAATNSGAAYVFRANTLGLWSFAQKLVGAGTDAQDHFGTSVIAAEDEILVAASHHADTAPISGSIFRFVDGGQGWIPAGIVHSARTREEQLFGRAMARSGDLLAVGAWTDPSGTVQIFHRQGQAWSYETTLVGTATDFGERVALEGSLLAVGADRHAYAYQAAGSVWERTALHPTGDFWRSSTAVAVTGDRVLVGDASLGALSGAAVLAFPLDPPGPIQPFGFGDGTLRPCPCDNDSEPDTGEGCRNSTGSGARLTGSGSASLGANDLVLLASQLPPGKPTQLFIGRNRLLGLPFGDGLRLVTVPFIRIPIRMASPVGEVTWSGLHATGFWGAGDTRYFQAFYRDPSGPCGSGFNLTSALQITFAH